MKAALKNKELQPVFTEEEIAGRVQAIAGQISKDFGSEPVYAIGILESGFIFLSDLVRKLTCPVACHFTKMESRDTTTGSQPLRSIVYGPITNVEGKNVLLVDVLVDSGITLDHLVQNVLLKKAKSVRTAALVDRENRRKLSFRVNYAGFTWEGESQLVGYGLAKDGFYRNLPYVATIDSANGSAQGEA